MVLTAVGVVHMCTTVGVELCVDLAQISTIDKQYLKCNITL